MPSVTAADVVVVGAGPAGSAAAHELASAGADVLVLERAHFPRDKSCGDGIAPHAVDMLRQMGVAFEAFGRRGRKMYGGTISGPSGCCFSAQPPPPAGGGRWESWIVPRELLDAEIARNAVRAGARLREGVTVTGLCFERGRVCGVDALDGGAERICAKIIIGADGAHSAVARALGYRENPPRHLGYALRAYYEDIDGLRDDLEIHYYNRAMLPGYGWVFPIGMHSANVGIGYYLGDLRRSRAKLRELLDDFILSTPAVKERFRRARLASRPIGWPLPVSSAHRPTVFDGAMLAGDAGSLIDPLTGEGIWTALVSGRSAARAALGALRSGDVSRHFLRAHEREWRAICGGYLSYGRILKNCAKSARLFDLVMKRASEQERYRSHAIAYALGILDRRRALRNVVLRAIFQPSFFRTERA